MKVAFTTKFMKPLLQSTILLLLAIKCNTSIQHLLPLKKKKVSAKWEWRRMVFLKYLRYVKSLDTVF